MEMESVFKFTRFLVILRKDNRVILINRNNGSWIKISNESYSIVKKAIELRFTKSKLLESFSVDEDKKYFNELLSLLFSYQILVSEDNFEETGTGEISIDFTNRCNLNCIHCMAEANDIFDRYEMDNLELKETIDKIVSVSPESITISGGEPMTRTDFFDLSYYLRNQYQGKMTLMTNGTLIKESNVHDLANIFNHISISLDGVDEKSTSMLRGKGVFTAAMNGIMLLKENGFKSISISMVETRINKHIIPQFINMCHELEAIPMIRAFAAAGRGEKVKDLLLVRTNYCPDINLAEEYINFTDYKEESPSISGVCSSTINSFYINAYGDIYPCAPLCDKKYLYGNIKDIKDFYKYIFEYEYKSSAGFSEFYKCFPENHSLCSSCDVHTFCWHCIFQQNQRIDNDPDFKTWCYLQRRELSSIWKEV